MTIKIPMNNWSVMLRRPLPLGYVGENNVEVIHIDIPDDTATYQLYIEPKYEGNAYWLPFDSEGNLEVTQSDFQKSGMYNGQIVATWSDESVKKSNIFAILIDKSICPVASQEDIDGFTKALAEYAKQVEDCKTTAETVTAEAKTVAEEAKEASKEARTASEEAQTVTAEAKKVAEEAQTATATAKAEAETAKAIADEIQAKADSGAFNGKDGAKGEKGDQGIQGIQGIQGEKGDKGDQGEKGDKGDTGANGEKGDQGEKGDTGSDGFSPTASVSQSGTDTTISITDKSGTTEATITELSAGTGIDISDHIVGINQTLEDRLYTMQHTKRVNWSPETMAYENFALATCLFHGVNWRYSNDVLNYINKYNTNILSQISSKSYYSSLSDAINDTNALSGSTGAVVCRYKSSPGYINDSYNYVLLADCTSSNETLSVSDNVIISLNGHVLTLDGSTLTANDLTKDFGVIGTTSGSKLVCQNNACITSYGNTYLVGGEIEAKDTSALLKTYDYVYDKTSTPRFNGHPSEVIIYGINGSGNTSINGYLFNHIVLQPSYIFYGHCNLKYTITGSATKGTVIDITTGATNMTAAKKASAEFRNCNIYHTDVGASSGDNVNSAIHMYGTHLHMLVDGCEISGEDNAFQQSDATVYVTKSVLSGGVHGGIYTTQGGGTTPYGRNLNDIAHGQVYITDSTLAKRATTKTGQNYYACYFGYGTNVVCDGVKFLDADGNLYTPAIKDGSGYGLNTEVSLSNCELKSVRCDSGCTVNLGRGISDDVKNASVSGTKNLTEDVYRYDLVLDM